MRSVETSISCELERAAAEAGEVVPLSACGAEGARSLARAIASSTILWARLGGLERWAGYDHAERVGRVPRDDEIQEP
jgi:hypothetical protein